MNRSNEASEKPLGISGEVRHGPPYTVLGQVQENHHHIPPSSNCQPDEDNLLSNIASVSCIGQNTNCYGLRR